MDELFAVLFIGHCDVIGLGRIEWEYFLFLIYLCDSQAHKEKKGCTKNKIWGYAWYGGPHVYLYI